MLIIFSFIVKMQETLRFLIFMFEESWTNSDFLVDPFRTKSLFISKKM